MQGFHIVQRFNGLLVFQGVYPIYVAFYNIRLETVFLVGLSRFVKFPQLVLVECYNLAKCSFCCKDSSFLPKIHKKVNFIFL